jgi:hypothetical protein
MEFLSLRKRVYLFVVFSSSLFSKSDRIEPVTIEHQVRAHSNGSQNFWYIFLVTKSDRV